MAGAVYIILNLNNLVHVYRVGGILSNNFGSRSCGILVFL